MINIELSFISAQCHVHYNEDIVYSYSMCTWTSIRQTSYRSGQKFQKVENEENRFFAIPSSKLFKNWFCKGHIFSNNIFGFGNNDLYDVCLIEVQVHIL